MLGCLNPLLCLAMAEEEVQDQPERQRASEEGGRRLANWNWSMTVDKARTKHGSETALCVKQVHAITQRKARRPDTAGPIDDGIKL